MLAGVPQLSDLVSVQCFEHSQKRRQVWKCGIAKELFFLRCWELGNTRIFVLLYLFS